MLHELHTAMKTHHTYQSEFRQAESKLAVSCWCYRCCCCCCCCYCGCHCCCHENPPHISVWAQTGRVKASSELLMLSLLSLLLLWLLWLLLLLSLTLLLPNSASAVRLWRSKSSNWKREFRRKSSKRVESIVWSKKRYEHYLIRSDWFIYFDWFEWI